MKTTILICAAFCAFVFSGCTTTGTGGGGLTPQQRAASERVIVSTAATIALANNPSYVPAVEALVVGIDVAIAKQATITPDQIADFVRGVCTHYNVAAKDVPIFVNLALSVYQTYATEFRTDVVSAIDPIALLYVSAFKDGLKDAILAVKGTG